MCCVQIKVGIFVAGQIGFKGGWSPGLKFLLLCWTHGLPSERRVHSHERLADERTRDKERKTKETGTPHVNTAVSAPHQTNSDRIEQTHTHTDTQHSFPPHNYCEVQTSETTRKTRNLNLEDLEHWKHLKTKKHCNTSVCWSCDSLNRQSDSLFPLNLKSRWRTCWFFN